MSTKTTHVRRLKEEWRLFIIILGANKWGGGHRKACETRSAQGIHCIVLIAMTPVQPLVSSVPHLRFLSVSCHFESWWIDPIDYYPFEHGKIICANVENCLTASKDHISASTGPIIMINIPLQRFPCCGADCKNPNAKALQTQKISDQTHRKLCSECNKTNRVCSWLVE